MLNQGARGFAEGVINILGLPQALMAGKNDVISAGLAKIGVPQDTDEFIGHLDPSEHLLPSAEGMQRGGDAFNEAFVSIFGVSPPKAEPDNMPERFANRIGEEVGDGRSRDCGAWQS